MQPIPEWPALNPWTRPIQIRAGQLRLVSADRTSIDLSPRDSAEVSAACELLSCRWPLTKILASEAAGRGIATLAGLGQLVDARILQMNTGTWDESDIGRVLTQAALRTETDPPDPLHAPIPLPPSVGVWAPPQWQPVIAQAFHNAGFDKVTELSAESRLRPQSSPCLEGITLIIIVGELNWTIVTRFMEAGLAHVLITPSATTVEVGPLVLPGASPCLRCAHLAKRDIDPNWPTTHEAIQDRAQPPLDPSLAHISGQLAAALSRSQTSENSNSSSVVLRTCAPFGETSITRVGLHPACNCCQQPQQVLPFDPVSDPLAA